MSAGAPPSLPGTTASNASSTTNIPDKATPVIDHTPFERSPGEGESALPADKAEEALENAEDDWEHDPANARNWTAGKKWSAVAIVCCLRS